MKTHQIFRILCGAAIGLSASAQTMIEGFEYGTEEELLAAWPGGGLAVVTSSDSVALRAAGTNSMKITFTFPETAWASEAVMESYLATPVSVASNQYLTFRLRGDPAFAAADFRNLYLKVWDVNGNCGRYSISVPLSDEWQIVNHLASNVESSWDCAVSPDLSQLARFAFLQYGSGAAIPPYTASIYVDELMIRDSPLTEFPAPSPARTLLDDFEGYANDTALRAFYSPENSPAATVTTVSLATPAPQGSNVMKLAVDFAPGQWPWGSVRSSVQSTPFSIPTNAVVSLKLKGDPSFAAFADEGTTFWISFYDKGGARINYSSGPVPVALGEWSLVEVPVSEFWGNVTTIDMGNIVQWRLLFEGWMGTAESTALSGAIYVDDVRITLPRPQLSMGWEGTNLRVGMEGLTVGKLYELQTSANLTLWTPATTITATAATASWTVQPGPQPAFFRLQETQ